MIEAARLAEPPSERPRRRRWRQPAAPRLGHGVRIDLGHNRDVTISDERRLVTVLFADLVGFTGRSESSDPEQVRELQRAYFGVVAAEVERYGGSVEKYIGDAAMALFGVPVAHDDDAERGLRAALAIREGVSALDDELEVRIGVNTGEVVGGPGGPQQGEYSVSGDAVNVAARLQQSARPNEILVGGTTRRLAYEAFGFVPRETMALKGRAEPVEAWQLEGALPERPRGGAVRRGSSAASVSLAPLSPPSRRRATVAGSWWRWWGSPGSGRAGWRSRSSVGPSRADSPRHGHPRARTHRSFRITWWASSCRSCSDVERRQAGYRCGASGRREPTPTKRRSRPGRASWTTCSAPPRRTAAELAELSPAGKQRILVHAIGALLRCRATSAPCCSSSTTSTGPIPPAWRSWRSCSPSCRTCGSRCSRRTARTGRTAGRAGAATSRSTFARCGLTTRVAWPPSWRRAPRSPRRSQSGSSSGPAATRSSWRSSSTGSAAQGGAEPRRLPASIHEMLLARLDALPADARRVLQLASVVGMEFDEPIVAALAETDAAATDEAFRTLQRASSSRPPEATTTDRALVFRHPLIHEVAYGSLLTSTRRRDARPRRPVARGERR